jgi:GNAT superfamily N-acetyltransferase
MNENIAMGWEPVFMGAVSLRRVSPQAAGDITAIMQRIYTYQYIWKDEGKYFLENVFSPTSVAAELQEENQISWIVSYENKEIGILKISSNRAPGDIPNQDFMKLHRIYLDKNFHGKGVGQILMDFVVAFSKAQRKKTLWLETMACVPKVIDFYKRNGFRYSHDILLPYPNAHEHLRPMHVMICPLES